MRFANLALRTKIISGNCIPLILLVILCAITTISVGSILRSSTWVNHTHSVIQKAMNIETSAVDMETGMRGYLLAGKEDFLTPYKAGNKRFLALVSSLKEAVNDNPAQVQRLEEIKDTVDAWQKDITEPAINLRRNIGDAKTMNDMAKIVGEARGKTYFDKFRAQIRTFIEREVALMGKRQKDGDIAAKETETNILSIVDTTERVNHTYEVIGNIDAALMAIVNIETGMRGYLLTGKKAFLEPYKSGIRDFNSIVAKTKALVGDNPTQVKRLEEIDNVYKKWQKSVTVPAIQLRKKVIAGSRTMEDVVALVARAKGKQYVDNIRDKIDFFRKTEFDLMVNRQEDAAKAAIAAKTGILTLSKTTNWVNHTHKVIQEAMKIEASAVDMETGMRGYLLGGKETFLAPYKNGSDRFDNLLAALKRTVDDNPAQVRLLGELDQTINEWQERVATPAIDLRRKIGDAKTMDDMADIVGEAKGKVYFDKFRDQIKTFIGKEAALMAVREDATRKTANNTRNILLFGTITTILLALVISFFIGRAIINPINRIIEGLGEGSSQVATASRQVSSASQSLADGSSQQAASIEETSSSLEEMSSMTKQNAENAGQADKLMTEANQVVKRANTSMEHLTHSMEEVSKASNETSKIIKTIDEIAFQTNLLALNAAVEAARAGEAGAGFAVVAEEVRNLAMRSAEAAKSTAELIEGTVKKVKDGSDLVNQTNQAFTEVAENSSKVGELIGEISEASREQSTGIEQVNTAVTEMDKVTQQNAANAEESASASEEMNAQAESMREFVNELLTLVGGSRSHNQPPTAKPLPKAIRTVAAAPSVKAKSLGTPKHSEVRPDQVIPFDEEDFTDF